MLSYIQVGSAGGGLPSTLNTSKEGGDRRLRFNGLFRETSSHADPAGCEKIWSCTHR